MKLGTITLTVLLLALFSGIAATAGQEATPIATPLPNTPPVGEFSAVPDSGPVGTVVTVSGDFDKNITGVRFRCLYRDTFDEGLVEAYLLPEPSPTFTFQFEIPAELSLRQGAGATRATLIGACAFLAMAGHQLLTASTPFTVTAGVLPSTGGGAGEAGVGREAVAASVLAVVGGGALALGRLFRRRAGRETTAVLVQIHG